MQDKHNKTQTLSTDLTVAAAGLAGEAEAVALGIMALLLRPKDTAALSCWPCQLDEMGLAAAAGLPERGGSSGGKLLAVWPPRDLRAYCNESRPLYKRPVVWRLVFGYISACTQATHRKRSPLAAFSGSDSRILKNFCYLEY